MDTFLYFAYGSNLLRQRLQLQNPSASFVTTAKLQDYQLVFNSFGKDTSKNRWKGGGASIQHAPGQHVWGCVWRLSNNDLATLDRQEATYNPTEVTVAGSDNEQYSCRTYQAENKMADVYDPRPSPFYMDVIIRGARQNGICDEYVTFLESIEHNGAKGAPEVYKDTMKLLDDSPEVKI